MKTKHLMIDLETLGLGHDAAVIQIGAALFDSDGVHESFEATIEFESAAKYGRIDANTVEWWLRQSKQAQDSIVEPEKDPVRTTEALCQFSNFILIHQPETFWSHATFDFPKLQYLQEQTGIKLVMNYRSLRDLRTAEHIYPEIEWADREDYVHHNAKSDAIYQAEHLVKMMKAHEELMENAMKYEGLLE